MEVSSGSAMAAGVEEGTSEKARQALQFWQPKASALHDVYPTKDRSLSIDPHCF